MARRARSCTGSPRLASKLGQTTGHRGQHHVVDLGVVAVGDLPGELQAAADDGQPAAGADRAVEAGAGGTPGEELAPDRERPRLPPAAGPGRVGEARAPVTDALEAPRQGVAEQLACGGDRGRCPRRRCGGGRVGVKVKEGAEGGHPGNTVGQGVMGPQEQTHFPLRQAGEQPGLPQGACGIQRSPAQRLAGRQELGLIGRRGQRIHPQVVGEVEGRRVDPQGPAQPPWRPVQALAEARDKREFWVQVPADLLEPDAPVVVEEPAAVQDGQRTDVLGPAELVEPQGYAVRAAQAVNAAWPGHDVHAPSARPSPPTLR
jgi:hypothetical protein